MRQALDRLKIKSETVILLTTFNPDMRILADNINSYNDQVDKIILCDNSPVPICLDNIKGNIELISLGCNKGIAYAQNISLVKAIELGYSYFIEMDQDSKLIEGYVIALMSDYLAISHNQANVFGIGPIAISEKDGSIYHNRGGLKGVFNVNHTLSSGFLFSKNSVEINGIKDEGLFIDLVDWEWCMRAKKNGLMTFVSSNVSITHSLGDKHINFLGKKLGVPRPFRHYFQFRNTIELCFRSYIPLSWKVNNISKLIFKFFTYPILLDKGLQRFKYICKGIFDGIRRKNNLQ